MYFKKISPNTTCLYSAASMEPRNSLAVAQSCVSKPKLAEVSSDEVTIACRAIAPVPSLRSFTLIHRPPIQPAAGDVGMCRMGKRFSLLSIRQRKPVSLLAERAGVHAQPILGKPHSSRRDSSVSSRERFVPIAGAHLSRCLGLRVPSRCRRGSTHVPRNQVRVSLSRR